MKVLRINLELFGENIPISELKLYVEVKTILETYLEMMTALLSFSIMIPSPVWNPEILKLTKANALIFSFRDLQDMKQTKISKYPPGCSISKLLNV